MIYPLLFSVDDVRCALPLRSVRIVLQMVQLGPAEKKNPAPAGTVNLHGQIIPVYSVRSFFGIPDRSPKLTDKLIVVETGDSCVALWVDETHIPEEGPVAVARPGKAEIREPLAPGAGLAGDGTILFTDLALFLRPDNFTVIILPSPPSLRQGTEAP